MLGRRDLAAAASPSVEMTCGWWSDCSWGSGHEGVANGCGGVGGAACGVKLGPGNKKRSRVCLDLFGFEFVRGA